jgi:uncharacterized coiled-coil DUF342 family protein
MTLEDPKETSNVVPIYDAMSSKELELREKRLKERADKLDEKIIKLDDELRKVSGELRGLENSKNKFFRERINALASKRSELNKKLDDAENERDILNPILQGLINYKENIRPFKEKG